MGSFLLYEIRNKLRLEGYEVTKHTNRRVINTLLDLKKDSTMKDICEKLEMSYIGREGNFTKNVPKEIFLHFLESKSRVRYNSIQDANKSIGIEILSDNGKIESVLEKLIFVNGEKTVLSFEKDLNTQQNFSRCLVNKININLALSQKLGYVVDHNISLPEIFDLLQEEIPKKRLKEKLCQLLKIPYFCLKPSSFSGEKRRKVLVKAQDEETLVFNSLSTAGKFFQVDAKTVSKMIDLHYRIPYWYNRYTLEFA